MTVIHDEAALASTREQHQLLTLIEQSGARVIEVGDPRQSKAVGAGGLWPHLEQTGHDRSAHVQLTHNVRAKHPADRRDQALFRAGEHDQALQGYAARGHVILSSDQHHAEDAALEAAHTDRQTGKRVLVIAQTSNEHLDELNARAQAIRYQSGELGEHSLPVTGRPYQLHAGDQLQIRNSINHPQHGYLPNGTTATVHDINPKDELATLTLAGDQMVILDRHQLDQASVRLAYVQHPFPAQGQTSDTTHLIIAEHTTEEGSYVALSRARDSTHIHAARDRVDRQNGHQGILALAERMSRQEPELPSIATPLALGQHHSHRQHERQEANHPDLLVLGETPDAREIAERHRRASRNGVRAPLSPDQLQEPAQPSQPSHHSQRLTTILGMRPETGEANRQTWDHAALVTHCV